MKKKQKNIQLENKKIQFSFTFPHESNNNKMSKNEAVIFKLEKPKEERTELIDKILRETKAF